MQSAAFVRVPRSPPVKLRRSRRLPREKNERRR